MSITAKQLSTAVTDWEEDYENEGLLDEYQSFWDAVIEETITLPGGIGEVKQETNGTYLDKYNDKRQFVIVKVGDQFFRITGWYDSWGGESEYDEGTLSEVEEVEVTHKEWRDK